MPNHVTNYLRVEGEVNRVNEFFEATRGKNSTGEDSDFTFNGIVPMPSETLRGDLGERERLEFPGDFNWHDWSINHWGTKWDAYRVNRLADNLVSFCTAWSAPNNFLTAASKRFPDLLIVNEWIEETTESAGQMKLQEGRLLVDVSSRYADWREVDFDCWIHRLNVKYDLDGYISYLQEMAEDGGPAYERYLTQLQKEQASASTAPAEFIVQTVPVAGGWLFLD